MSHLFKVENGPAHFVLDLRVGHLRELVLVHNSHRIAPLHTAPWVDDESIWADETILPNVRALSGDFLCAPFGRADIEPAPGHGWSANSSWVVEEVMRPESGVVIARFRLERKIMGSTVFKELSLREGHPFLYQRHIFAGGSGALPITNHAMVDWRHAELSFSRKRFIRTPARAVESNPVRGRSAFLYPQTCGQDGAAVGVDGTQINFTRLPFAERHEDFVVMAEAPGTDLGWFALRKHESDEVFLSLKSARQHPFTMLWFSNGGRYYSPWNGRHVGVVGIEEGRSYAGYGHAASIADNEHRAADLPTSFELDPNGIVDVRHIVGAVRWPAERASIVDLRKAPADAIILIDGGGHSETVNLDTGFLDPTAAGS